MSDIPYTTVLESTLRAARRRIEEGGTVRPTLYMLAGEHSANDVLPSLATVEQRQRFLFDQGRQRAWMRPQAVCVLSDVPGGAPGLFGEQRILCAAYRDYNGLRRAWRQPYELEAVPPADLPVVRWGEIEKLADDALLRDFEPESFFNGVASAQREQQDRKRYRQPAWRFRR